MQRYFIKNEQISNNTIIIIGNDYHHIKNVMRMKEKSKIYVCDENQKVYLCEIFSILDDSVLLNIIEEINEEVELAVNVTIAFGLTKRDKQEEVLRRITELGASGFFSVTMERSVVKVKENKASSKLERMKTIVKEASEQSHRSKLLVVEDVHSFKEFINKSDSYDLKLYAYEEVRQNNFSFKDIIRSFKGKSIIILVGPEGGISEKEVKILVENDFKAIGLGPRILRCETAPLYVMSAISYELELKNES